MSLSGAFSLRDLIPERFRPAALARRFFPRPRPRRRAEIALCFHMNQNVVPYADFVGRRFYARFLDALENHPDVPVHLEISGSLFTALAWFHPDLLERIGAMVTAGQVELLGSTFSQNILYASTPDENRLQMRLHRATLRRAFGVEPIGFWNPERVFYPRLVSDVAAHGYRYTLLEDRVLRDLVGPARAGMPVLLESGEDRLIGFRDDNELRARINRFIHGSGSWSEVLDRFDDVATATGHPPLLVYAEDAEAIGLWNFEKRGSDGPRPAGAHAAGVDAEFDRFSELLSLLSPRGTEAGRAPHAAALAGSTRSLPYNHAGHAASNVVPVALSLQTPPIGILPPGGKAEVAGAAPCEPVWIEQALRDPAARYHEPGYRSWFDYNERAPGIVTHRESFPRVQRVIDEARRRIATEVTEEVARAAGTRMVDLSELLAVIHRYEFGCIGTSRERAAHLARIRTAAVPAAVFIECQRRKTPIQIDLDLDADREPETLLSTGQNTLVLSRAGHLRHWFHQESGAELLGGHAATYITEEDGPGPERPPVLRFREPLWPWLSRHDLAADEHVEYRLRRGAFFERFAIRDGDGDGDGGGVSSSDLDPVRFEPARRTGTDPFPGRSDLSFEAKTPLGPGPGALLFRKRLSPGRNTLSVTWTLTNRSDHAANVEFRIESAFAPDSLIVLREGLRSLVLFDADPRGPVIVNRRSGFGLRLEFGTLPPSEIRTPAVVLSQGLDVVYDLALPPGVPCTLQMFLTPFRFHPADYDRIASELSVRPLHEIRGGRS